MVRFVPTADPTREATMPDSDYDTSEQREIDRARGYRTQRKILPSKRVQERYPLAQYPCDRCEKEGVPHLIDAECEFYWHHQPPGYRRSGCPRFGDSEFCGNKPRRGTAVSLWKTNRRTMRKVLCTEEEYLKNQQAVEEKGSDGYAIWYGVDRG